MLERTDERFLILIPKFKLEVIVSLLFEIIVSVFFQVKISSSVRKDLKKTSASFSTYPLYYSCGFQSAYSSSTYSNPKGLAIRVFF